MVVLVAAELAGDHLHDVAFVSQPAEFVGVVRSRPDDDRLVENAPEFVELVGERVELTALELDAQDVAEAEAADAIDRGWRRRAP